MGIRDWDIVTSYVDSVTTSLKTVTFPKVQEQVKVKNQGNANLTYTIGSQSGTLTPGQSITVNEDISSFSIQAASGTQAFELRAKEKGTEQTETETDVMTALTWDVKIDKCYIWALSQDYGIGITNGSGNTTITNTDIVPPLKTLTTRKAGIWIDSSVSACFNTKMTNVYFDGNPSLDTGVGLLITPRTGLVTLSDFSANKMDDDVVVIDSAFGVTVERGLFSNNNDKGTGTREIYIKKSGSQALENINIRNNQFVQTTTITGTVAPTINDFIIRTKYVATRTWKQVLFFMEVIR
jgi:hypothetical protein